MTEHANIAAALVAALGDLTNVAKEHKGGGGGKTYTYANLPDLIDATRPKLAEHGLVALTPIHDHPDGLACTVVLLHTSGERLDFGPFSFPAGRDAQATGSWVTYVRRYSLLAALGMGAEDDDGASAKPAEPRQQKAQERPVTPSGLTAAEAGAKVQATLEAEGVPADEIVGHAKQVWRDVKPGAKDGIVPDDEVERLVDGAKRHAADLKAMAS